MHENPTGVTRRLGGGMIALAFILLLGMLTLFFQERLEERRNPNRDPAARVADGVREVTLRANAGGHYLTVGHIDGEPVEFLVDTGASDVAIPQAVAERLGLRRGPARSYHTANGIVRAHTTRLGRLELGPIRLHDVAASITPGMPGETVLLGMSALRELELTQRGRMLVIRQPF